MIVLPFDVLAKIFRFLDPRALFAQLPLVNRAWSVAALHTLDFQGRIPLEVQIRSPPFGQKILARCRVRTGKKERARIQLWDTEKRVGGRVVVGMVMVEISHDFLAESTLSQLEEALKWTIVSDCGGGLNVERMKLLISGIHLDGFESESEEKTSTDILSGLVEFVQHARPCSINISETFLEHHTQTPDLSFPSISSISYYDSMTAPAFDAAIQQMLQMFPNLRALSYYGWRHFAHLPQTLRDSPEFARISTIQYWCREAQVESTDVNCHIYSIPSLLPSVTDLGRPLVFPDMWAKILNRTTNSLNGIDRLAGLTQLTTFRCCVSFRPDVARSFLPDVAAMRPVADGFVKYMPNVQCIMIQPVRLYDVLADDVVDRLVQAWEYFVRVVPARKIVWVGSYAGKCPAPNLVGIFEGINRSCKDWGKEFATMQWGDVYSTAILSGESTP
ncbi:hypothetical protein HDU93_006275 [Gonapodya sp. JEL0774]|nr:hypothetical protein HDU93_006275 [Gonapodya sp. JEL0774]